VTRGVGWVDGDVLCILWCARQFWQRSTKTAVLCRRYLLTTFSTVSQTHTP